MQVLAIIHGERVRAGIFGEVVEELGHRLEEWSLAWGKPPPRPLDDYGAVLLFGGRMHADQEEHHPWLRDETALLERLLFVGMPVLGVCFGAQLITKAAHAPVHPAPEPEIGWVPVELTQEAADDALFGNLPERFDAFEWHYYTYGVPPGGVELARSAGCTQAFRFGERVWGIQFHAEVTREQIEGWVEDHEAEAAISPEQLIEQTRARIGRWNELGRELCSSFVEAAERVGAEPSRSSAK